MKKLRAGIVGCGRISVVYRSMDRLEVCFVADEGYPAGADVYHETGKKTVKISLPHLFQPTFPKGTTKKEKS
ncbi:MAG: hypothetical protein HFG27_06325 [Provencibacterium sp.]|jgi:hypothetical protein|nr:hypothetical protein [Provencibacterium sp.]